MKKDPDFIFFGVLGLMIGSTLIEIATGDYILTVGHYLAIVFLLLAFTLKLKTKRIGKYALPLLMLLGLFNICNFLLFGFTATLTFFITFQVNPVMLMLMLVYYFINKKVIDKRLSITFKRSEAEDLDEQQKKINFYLEKFETSTELELTRAYQYFDDYPPEAQMALTQLKARNTVAQH